MSRRQLYILALSFLHLPLYSRAEILSTQDWAGSLGINYQRRMFESNTSEVKTQLVGDLSGKYYLWQPWFLTGNLRVNFTADETAINGIKTQTNTLGGSLTANILPLSRTPLSIGYSKSENTISDSDSFVNSTGQTINLGDSSSSTSYYVVQKYLGNRFKLAASYHYNENESDNNGRYSSAIRKIEFGQRDRHSDVNLSLQQRDDHQHTNGEQRENKTAVLRHNYYPSQDINIANFVSSIDQLDQRDLDGDGIVDEYHNAIDQVSSLITWRSADKKGHITGNLRYTGIQSEQVGSTYDNISGNAGISARYRINNNVTTRASVGRTNSEINNISSEQSNSAIMLRYSSDNIDIGSTRYNWGASASGAQSSTNGVSENTQELSLEHGASHYWNVGRKTRINLGANQNLTQQEVSRQDTKVILTQGIRLGYTRSTNGSTQYAQGSYSENRITLGEEEFSSHSNIQLSHQQRLNPRSSFNTSLTHQQSRYQDSLQDTESISSSLLLNYTTRRDFMFQTIHFNSNIRYSTMQSSLTRTSERYTWDNILKHQIGKLNSSVTFRAQKIDGVTSRLLLVTTKRQF